MAVRVRNAPVIHIQGHMKKTALIGVALLATALLAGCESNPALNASLAKLMAPQKTAAEPTVGHVAAAPIAPTAAQDSASLSKAGGPTGLIGKKVTPKALPKNSDTRNMEYGNDYFACGGASWEGAGPDIAIVIMRKGLRSKCNDYKEVAAIVKSSNNNNTFEFLDTVDLTWVKGYLISTMGCTGASIAITKDENVPVYTKHIRAWNVVGNKFVPVTNLKSVKCVNESFGMDTD